MKIMKNASMCNKFYRICSISYDQLGSLGLEMFRELKASFFSKIIKAKFGVSYSDF